MCVVYSTYNIYQIILQLSKKKIREKNKIPGPKWRPRSGQHTLSTMQWTKKSEKWSRVGHILMMKL
jgi:hypothetical protein